MALCRSDIVDYSCPGLYHCISRCVRREQLLNSSRRRHWLVERLKTLAASMAIDVVAYTVMPNHLHLLLRIRPDLAARLTPREIAERTLALREGRSRSGSDGKAATRERLDGEVSILTSSPGRLARARRELSNLGTFHKLLKEPCARAWNQEDGVTGHFWEGRFLSPRVLDSESIEKVARYIELNEIRACICNSIQDSTWSSARSQWLRLKDALESAAGKSCRVVREHLEGLLWEPAIPCHASESVEPPDGSRLPKRTLFEHLATLDLVGRMPRADKRGFIKSTSGTIVGQLCDEISHARRHLKAMLHRELSRVGRLVAQSMETIANSDSFNRSRRVRTQLGSCYGRADSCRIEAERRGVRNTVARILTT